MKVREVLTKRDRLAGKTVKIEGLLRLSSECFLGVWRRVIYISPDIASADNYNESILIQEYDKIQSQLRGKVPMIVGGPTMYECFATVTGTLCQSEIEAFPVALTSVTLLRLQSEKGKVWLPRSPGLPVPQSLSVMSDRCMAPSQQKACLN